MFADRLLPGQPRPRGAVARSETQTPPPDGLVAVLKGAATEGTYTFTEPVISIGRSEDPTDELGRVRRNRVAFLDTVDGVTETVGRAHARLRFDADVQGIPAVRRRQQQRDGDHPRWRDDRRAPA